MRIKESADKIVTIFYTFTSKFQKKYSSPEHEHKLKNIVGNKWYLLKVQEKNVRTSAKIDRENCCFYTSENITQYTESTYVIIFYNISPAIPRTASVNLTGSPAIIVCYNIIRSIYLLLSCICIFIYKQKPMGI